MLRIAVEQWAPEYGTAMADPDTMTPTDVSVDPDVECKADQWQPVAPTESPYGGCTAFVDGVRRIDASLWITGDDGVPKRGICASIAAGMVISDDRARFGEMVVRRGAYSAMPLESIETRVGPYQPHAVVDDRPEALSLGVQQRLAELEVAVCRQASDPYDLLIVDGPLRGRHDLQNAVGYVKTHQVGYLPDDLPAVVSALAPGERTPLFLTTTSWTRFSWYVRLPENSGPHAHPWSGIVRMEASGDLPVAEAIALAQRATDAILPFASVPHKDPRAPQNLFPIAGLERQLRHRLGDPALVHRAIQRAVFEGG